VAGGAGKEQQAGHKRAQQADAAARAGAVRLASPACRLRARAATYLRTTSRATAPRVSSGAGAQTRLSFATWHSALLYSPSLQHTTHLKAGIKPLPIFSLFAHSISLKDMNRHTTALSRSRTHCCTHAWAPMLAAHMAPTGGAHRQDRTLGQAASWWACSCLPFKPS